MYKQLQTNNVLSTFHSHERDQNITFKEAGHIYTILIDPTSKYTSVTTWIHSHFPKFDTDLIILKIMRSKSWKVGHKYWGLTREQIKDSWNKNRDSAAGAGTEIHFEIECFMNNVELPNNYTHQDLYNDYTCKNPNSDSNIQSQKIEWNYFIHFVKEFPTFKPYRTEWMIYYEELKLAGSIDMVYENEDGTLSIYDWKRAANITKLNDWERALTDCVSHLPNSNFWHYALQLNTYKTILERKYDKIVTKLCLVKLHPNNEDKTYEIIDVPILEKEMNDLFEERRKQFSNLQIIKA